MKPFWVEGLFKPAPRRKRGGRSGVGNAVDIEPFARVFWAESVEQALAMAKEALEGGTWQGEPKVSLTSEEQRMRSAGAAEFPGFATLLPNASRRQGKARGR